MENTEQQALDLLLRQIREQEGEGFVYDRAEINAELEQSTPLLANLPVKLLTILGGILASLFLLGFLFATGLYDSPTGMLVAGLLLLAGSVAVIRIRKDTLAETSCVSFHIIGYLLFGIGFSGLFQSEDALYSLLALMALGVLFAAANSILTFLAVLVFSGSLAAIILNHQALNLMHGYIGAVAGLLTYLSLREATLISLGSWFSRVYGPVRMGLVVTLVAALALLMHQPPLPAGGITHYWLSGVLLIAAVLFVLSKVMRQAGLANRKQQLLVYACCGLVLAPTVLSPAVPGALLVLLTSFYIGHKTSFAAGVLSLVYFVILYYYDLQLTLLQKSGVLVLTGALFIGGYLLLQKHLKNDAN
ncbi:hypothetical protein GCM10023188_25180 [Pontibacter saemangeumensis]|uniref:DUF4401 domain-containing protein n=1 Tax=Pontibacter saemangeumensis TaxID=1084525 RepID=A0ABP8LQR0_9BACT